MCICVHHLFLLSCPISIPCSHSHANEYIFRMSDSNYTAFEGGVTRMAFGSPDSRLVYDRGSLHYVVSDVVYCHIYLVYTFWKFACLPSGDRYLYCFVS